MTIIRCLPDRVPERFWGVLGTVEHCLIYVNVANWQYLV
nr:MAG TPA: hypothetical protein [Caudoviricetes sp.]